MDFIPKASEYDKIIMFTYNVKDNDHHVKLFNQLDKSKVIVVSMRSPYDLLKLNGCESYICMYEPTIDAMESLSKVLMGQIVASGKLPIKL